VGYDKKTGRLIVEFTAYTQLAQRSRTHLFTTCCVATRLRIQILVFHSFMSTGILHAGRGFFMGGETPKEIRAICPMACLKFEQVNRWMRAGGKKRPIWPMRTWKFSLLASTNAPFDAQTLLNLYAMDPAWAGGPTP
jgi:hypothetical protein